MSCRIPRALEEIRGGTNAKPNERAVRLIRQHSSWAFSRASSSASWRRTSAWPKQATDSASSASWASSACPAAFDPRLPAREQKQKQETKTKEAVNYCGRIRVCTATVTRLFLLFGRRRSDPFHLIDLAGRVGSLFLRRFLRRLYRTRLVRRDGLVVVCHIVRHWYVDAGGGERDAVEALGGRFHPPLLGLLLFQLADVFASLCLLALAVRAVHFGLRLLRAGCHLLRLVANALGRLIGFNLARFAGRLGRLGQLGRLGGRIDAQRAAKRSVRLLQILLFGEALGAERDQRLFERLAQLGRGALAVQLLTMDRGAEQHEQLVEVLGLRVRAGLIQRLSP